MAGYFTGTGAKILWAWQICFVHLYNVGPPTKVALAFAAWNDVA